MKTPERIATDTEKVVEQITKRLFEQVSHGVVKGRGNTDLAQITWWGLFDQIEAAVRAGIEADREQRAAEATARLASIAAGLIDNGPLTILPDWRDGSPNAEYLRSQMELLADFAGIDKEAALVLIEAQLIMLYIKGE